MIKTGSTDIDYWTELLCIDIGKIEGAIQRLMERFCFTNWKEMSVLRQEIYIIDDELDWDKSNALQRLESLLKKYQSIYKEKISETGT